MDIQKPHTNQHKKLSDYKIHVTKVLYELGEDNAVKLVLSRHFSDKGLMLF